MTEQLRVIDWDRVQLGINAVRESRGMSWRVVGRQSGIGEVTSCRLGAGSAISADALVALFAWAGISDIRPYLLNREAS